MKTYFYITIVFTVMSQIVLVYDRCKTIGYANMVAIVFQIDNKRNFFKRTKVKTELSEFPFSFFEICFKNISKGNLI